MFQDFNHLSERRKAERAQKRRKKIAIIAGVSVVVLVVIVGAIIAVVYGSHQDGKTRSHEIPSTNQVSRLQKGIKMICTPTDYKKTCESSLTKVMSSNSSGNPKELMKAAVLVIVNELDKAFNNSIKGKIDDPKVIGAIQDCQILLRDAKEELGETDKDIKDIN